MADTVTIIPNQTFKHGKETYEVGKSYEVAESLAFHFAQVGWLGDMQVSGEQQTLEVQGGQIGHASEVK
jgi:hypothetical protein